MTVLRYGVLAPPASSSMLKFHFVSLVVSAIGAVACGKVESGKPAPNSNASTPDGSATPGPTGWTMLGYDAASTYFNRNEWRISRQSVGQLREAFTLDLGGSVNGAPLQVGGRLYASAFTRNVAVDLRSGTIVWEDETFGSTASFAYDKGTLYAHGWMGVLYALNAGTGALIWETPLDDHFAVVGFSSPIVAMTVFF